MGSFLRLCCFLGKNTHKVWFDTNPNGVVIADTDQLDGLFGNSQISSWSFWCVLQKRVTPLIPSK
jgi:hypothetical protein